MLKYPVPERLATVIARFPEESHSLLSTYFTVYSFRLMITHPSKLKLGSFRVLDGKHEPVIRLNNDLGPFSFLLVFLHELAHLTTWRKYKRTVAPHGAEWKNEFYRLTSPLLEENQLPELLSSELRRFFIRTPASFNRDTRLQRLIHQLDGKGELILLGDLAENAGFKLLNGKQLIKLHRIRTRFKCFCPTSRRYYLVSPAAQIFPVEKS